MLIKIARQCNEPDGKQNEQVNRVVILLCNMWSDEIVSQSKTQCKIFT